MHLKRVVYLLCGPQNTQFAMLILPFAGKGNIKME